MAIILEKKSTINLTKDNGESLKSIYVGLNWGKIKTGGFLGFGGSSENIDLDSSVALFDKNNKHVDTVSFRQLRSKDGAIKHSGDDRSGDDAADDNDNEVISLALDKIDNNVGNIVFFLNSYSGQSFGKIPYSKIRILENNQNKVFATFNLSAESSFDGKVSMVMGKLTRLGDNWKFTTIGEPTNTKGIDDTINHIKNNYL